MKKFGYLLISSCLFLAVGCGDDAPDPPTPDAAPDVDAPVDPVQDCAMYCDTVTSNCVGNDNQFGPDLCSNVCASWAVGTPDDQAGNTLGCHIYHSTAAAGDPTTHCPHGGPTGADVCGAPCDNFCELALTACVGANEQYADMATCLAECNAFDMATPYNADQISGDTFACRFYHLTAAATDPETHCAHIVAASTVCIP